MKWSLYERGLALIVLFTLGAGILELIASRLGDPSPQFGYAFDALMGLALTAFGGYFFRPPPEGK